MAVLDSSYLNDPEKWEAEPLPMPVATFENNAAAKECAWRWNAYPELLTLLCRCEDAIYDLLGGNDKQNLDQAQRVLAEVGKMVSYHAAHK